MDDGRATPHTRGVASGSGPVRDRDLRVVAGAICLSALGDGIALIALGLRAKELGGGDMEAGLAIAGIFISLWAPVVVLSGHVGLLVDRVETRGLLVAVSAAQACVALALAFVGSLWLLLMLAVLLGSGIAIAQAAEFALVPLAGGRRTLQAANGIVETARALGFAIGPVCGSILVAVGGTAAAMRSTRCRSSWSVPPACRSPSAVGPSSGRTENGVGRGTASRSSSRIGSSG